VLLVPVSGPDVVGSTVVLDPPVGATTVVPLADSLSLTATSPTGHPTSARSERHIGSGRCTEEVFTPTA